jgi:DNA polymerase-3 subunit epsilon
MRTVYLDLETTGLLPSEDEIVEIGILDEQGQPLLDTLVRPIRHTSWPEAERINGISREDVASAPILSDLRSQIIEAVTGNRVVIYNAAFDSAFLASELRTAAEIECAMLAFAEVYGEWNPYYEDWRWGKTGGKRGQATFFNSLVYRLQQARTQREMYLSAPPMWTLEHSFSCIEPDWSQISRGQGAVSKACAWCRTCCSRGLCRLRNVPLHDAHCVEAIPGGETPSRRFAQMKGRKHHGRGSDQLLDISFEGCDFFPCSSSYQDVFAICIGNGQQHRLRYDPSSESSIHASHSCPSRLH